MTFKEIQELVKMIGESEIAEFNLKDGEFRLSIKTKHYQHNEQSGREVPPAQPFVAMPPVQQPFTPSAPPAPASPASEAPQAKQAAAPKEETGEGGGQYLEIKSPIVGTFYRSSSPEKPPYVKVGDTVETGNVVCIVEAMKLFNEIESEISGKIVKVLVEDAQPVEYDQVLFLVDPNG
jgi:acetyl-CoA carboxylase biotin carboxyl carrier protein